LCCEQPIILHGVLWLELINQATGIWLLLLLMV